MGFSSNGMGSVRNNRKLQNRTKGHFQSKGKKTMPIGFYDEKDKSPSFANLQDAMQVREARIFAVFGVLCVGLGLLLTMWFL